MSASLAPRATDAVAHPNGLVIAVLVVLLMVGAVASLRPAIRARRAERAEELAALAALDAAVEESPIDRPPLQRPARPRSLAWLLYVTFAIVSLIAVVVDDQPRIRVTGLVVAALCGLYARYLFRGGRWVVVPVPGCAPVLIIGLGVVVTLPLWYRHLV